MGPQALVNQLSQSFFRFYDPVAIEILIDDYDRDVQRITKKTRLWFHKNLFFLMEV